MQLQCQIEISGILCKADNVQIEDDVVALDEDEYSSCVIDFLDYGSQTTARESAEIGEDVSEEAEASNEVEHEHRDPDINHHYTCSTTDSQISTLTYDTNDSMVD